ncbi:hypothetical protein HFN20_00515 [Paenibacillus dendritiformis]|nr:hypothetical protein [Paenibacillus dendritiformis]NKI19731.1 hypothetical protein [Paenibacillus dendritiformis]NRG00540.1 hypothetical protein [Paenibacillus dendritiformis]
MSAGIMDIIPGAVSLLSAGLATTALVKTLRGIEDKNKKRIAQFESALLNALKISSIDDIKDVQNLYIGIGITNDINKQEYAITNLLREFLVNLISNKFEASEQQIRDWKSKITEIISEYEELLPNEELPQPEKSIINDVDSYLELKDFDSAKRKLGELSGIIKTRKDHLNKLEKSNKISNFVAIVGIVLTIVFGTLSIVLPFIIK